MTEQGNDEVEPIARAHPALPQMLAPDHLLAHQRDADRVAQVVIRCIAVGNQLERHVANIRDYARVVRLEGGVGGGIGLLQLLHERVDHDCGGIEHVYVPHPFSSADHSPQNRGV